MTMGKWMRYITAGMLLGILVIGLLPFLLVYSMADLLGTIDLDSSPLSLLFTKLIGIARKTESDDSKQQDADTAE
ncbi:hypothetical protein [Paenibacillus spongiae]|uniref:Uncharacterized protein n=1 Tax=Paenibacillus spongiae TaxID=2909671 RepID=A0ABY5SEV2_9BACL|nr:hypothetical protein [Paenibacillus spongiae]UVI32015.1 hypothetical protein L1F29_09450 [Paenibacillus spongiae]